MQLYALGTYITYFTAIYYIIYASCKYMDLL